MESQDKIRVREFQRATYCWSASCLWPTEVNKAMHLSVVNTNPELKMANGTCIIASWAPDISLTAYRDIVNEDTNDSDGRPMEEKKEAVIPSPILAPEIKKTDNKVILNGELFIIHRFGGAKAHITVTIIIPYPMTCITKIGFDFGSDQFKSNWTHNH